MFELAVSWINKTVFPWFNSANATHNVLLGAIGSILAAIFISLTLRVVLQSWSYARRVTLDEKRKNRSYLKLLERRLRMFIYWESATLGQRLHFVLLRVTLILSGSLTMLVCQGFLTLGVILKELQERNPENVIRLINAARNATDGPAVAMIQQQYFFPAMVLQCVIAVGIFLFCLSSIIYLLKIVRLAELEDPEALIATINSIRMSLDLPRLFMNDKTLSPSPSLLYPS
ncbi:hypothetical protein [Herbaspirillum sp. YR522]|uniref:hypothetical protein n=1 Tax=Herbaspirillum sp. YR522 TaxID=1144342 RepID=UPI00026F772B|nr:hypothetical protein [Herbaspirillum sp. YR522]EJM96372.1 hypothetical protein PMI40_04604 [Herbaspirillum sp. YR522]